MIVMKILSQIKNFVQKRDCLRRKTFFKYQFKINLSNGTEIPITMKCKRIFDNKYIDKA